MVTALTYQLQGWLASLMSNPRRRRTIIMIITASFILLSQLPNLFNFLTPWGAPRQARMSSLASELARLDRESRAPGADVVQISSGDGRRSSRSSRTRIVPRARPSPAGPTPHDS